jgi:hypothetical protein
MSATSALLDVLDAGDVLTGTRLDFPRLATLQNSRITQQN